MINKDHSILRKKQLKLKGCLRHQDTVNWISVGSWNGGATCHSDVSIGVVIVVHEMN